ncbi:hypothetical protein MWU59_13775 [Flavobacteriaceae bacterium F08102]|nr:hypothetical protein [Flavobacteriaceae bacterium F08102]
MMKRMWIVFIAVTLILSGCNGQEKQKDQNNEVQNVPKKNIVVNKEFDEDGNLIKYDSTYTYYYSNIENNATAEDSIINNFKHMFELKYPFFNKPYFNNLFFEDSLMKYDFYKKDFFTQRFLKNWQRAEKIFHEMDSIKNKFFTEQFPKKSSD